jgi:Ser/Thr protein kinase RdoA (MazF antagonist)
MLMLEDAQLTDWCNRKLGSPPADILFRTGHLAQVIGVSLTDGRSVVVKIRPSEPRIAACMRVQRHLAASGFPCPAPLAAPSVVGQLIVHAETLIAGGRQLPPAEHGAQPYAALLAWLIRSASGVPVGSSLAPSPPWTGWDHSGARLWPDRDDYGRDLNERLGPAWVDDAARKVRRRMLGYAAPSRIGHGDWESQNLRWDGDQPLAVHDWDSVIAQPEVAIAGLAAAVWPAGLDPVYAATVGQSADFIACYPAAAGLSWSRRDIEHCWAAGLWVLLFNAKKEAYDGGGPQLDRLAGEIAERLALAALRDAE